MSDPYIGEIRIFAFDYAPIGWAFCNGQTVPAVQNQALLAVIGTIYGGDGVNTVGLPNLMGRAPMCFGQGTNLTPRAIAAQTGASTVTLTATQMASHTHALNAQNATANLVAPLNNYFAKGNATQSGRPANVNTYSATMTPTALSPTAIGVAGGGQSHPNMQPYQTVNLCIALEGIFPVRP